MLPRSLRQRPIRTVANVAVALTLAAWVVLERVAIDARYEYGYVRGSVVGAGLVFGVLSVPLLRSKRTVGSTGLRWGWLLLGVLSMIVNTVGTVPLGRPFFDSLSAADAAIYWLPMALLALVFFGAPIARAEQLGERGLAGREEGERLVGLLTAAAGTLAAAINMIVLDYGSIRELEGSLLAPLPGVVLGLFAAFFANGREGRRRRFVADVEAGSVEHYRVEDHRIVRVTKPAGDGYRAAEHRDPVAELDESGEVVRTRQA